MTSRKILQRWIDAAFCVEQKQGLIPRYFSVAFLVGSQKAREQTRVWQLACNSRNRESSCSSLAVRPQQPLPAPRQAALKSRRNQLSLVGGHVVPLQHLAATTAKTRNSTKILQESKLDLNLEEVKAKQAQRGCGRSTRDRISGWEKHLEVTVRRGGNPAPLLQLLHSSLEVSKNAHLVVKWR